MNWWTALCLAAAAVLLWQQIVCRRRIHALKKQLKEALANASAGQQRDPLTGLESRASLEQRLQEICGDGIVAVLDLDDFRRLNELLGHLGGDEVLRAIGRFVLASIREKDRAFRWGGDEFVLLFSDVEPEVARIRMSQIEQRLRHFQIRHYGEVSIGVSWGIARTAGRPLCESLDEADRAMYASKRNRLHN